MLQIVGQDPNRYADAHAEPTALLTDHYELTMVRAASVIVAAFRHSPFELFASAACRLPLRGGRVYRWALEAIEAFTSTTTISLLAPTGIIDDQAARMARRLPVPRQHLGLPPRAKSTPGFAGDDRRGLFAEGVILETVLLSVYNYDSAVRPAARRDDRHGG